MSRTAQTARMDEHAAKAIRARAFDPTLALDECFAAIFAGQRDFIRANPPKTDRSDRNG